MSGKQQFFKKSVVKPEMYRLNLYSNFFLYYFKLWART